MSNQVVRTVTYTQGSIGAVGREFGRTPETAHQFRNKDIDPSRTHLNVFFVRPENGLYGAWKTKCKELNVSNADNLRKNATAIEGFVITSDRAFFDRLGYVPGQPPTPEIMQWAQESFDWLCEFYGKENIIGAVLHLDETTPHLQCYGIPIVEHWKEKVLQYDENGQVVRNANGSPVQLRDSKNKLVWKDHSFEECGERKLSRDAFWKNKGGNTSYSKMQDSYYEAVSKKYGLERGEIGSNKEHIDKKVWEAQQLEKKVSKAQKELDKVEAKTDKLKAELAYSNEGVVDVSLIPNKANTADIQAQNKALKRELGEMQTENGKLKEKVAEYEKAASERDKRLHDRDSTERKGLDASDKLDALDLFLANNPNAKAQLMPFFDAIDTTQQYAEKMLSHKQSFVACREREKKLRSELAEVRTQLNEEKDRYKAFSAEVKPLVEAREKRKAAQSELALARGIRQMKHKSDLKKEIARQDVTIAKHELALMQKHDVTQYLIDTAALWDAQRDKEKSIRTLEKKEQSLVTDVAKYRGEGDEHLRQYRICQHTVDALETPYSNLIQRRNSDYIPAQNEYVLSLSPSSKVYTSDIDKNTEKAKEAVKEQFSWETLKPILAQPRAADVLNGFDKKQAKERNHTPTR